MAENVNLDLAEYNAFGPWAYEISDKYPVPRLFVPYFESNDDAIMKIKIPREIERRNANPGMDLYDYVIALYEDRLRVLERQDSQVKEHVITSQDFMGVRIYENILKGGYTIFSSEGTVSFPFNGVSIDLFQKFTDLVFEKLRSGKQYGKTYDTAGFPVTETAPEAVFLINKLHDIQIKNPDVRLGAVQKSVDAHRNGSTQDMIERMLWKEMNPEALHLYTEQDLIVLENGLFPNRVGMEDFGYTQTIIPLNRISGVEVISSPEYSLMEECIISMGPNKVVYHFDIDNEEVAAFYNAFK